MAKYLDDIGLTKVWNKIKTLVGTKADSNDLSGYLPIEDFNIATSAFVTSRKFYF